MKLPLIAITLLQQLSGNIFRETSASVARVPSTGKLNVNANIFYSFQESQMQRFLEDFLEWHKLSQTVFFLDESYSGNVRRLFSLEAASLSVVKLSSVGNLANKNLSGTAAVHNTASELKILSSSASRTCQGHLLLVMAVQDPEQWLTKVLHSHCPEQPVLVLLPHSSTPSTTVRLPLHNKVVFGSRRQLPSTSVSLWETYTVTRDTAPATSLLGEWSPSGGLNISPIQWWGRRSSLLGADLGCLMEMQEPASLVYPLPGGGWNITGWAPDLLAVLQSLLNFTCIPRPAPDRQWGSQMAGGSWSGMVGELGAGRGDLIATMLDNTEARGRIVDFLVPTESSSYVLVMRSQIGLGSFWRHYTSEFSSGAWLCLALVLGTGAALCRGIVNTSPGETLSLTKGEALLITMGAFFGQSSPLVATGLSGKITQLTLLLTGVLLSCHYTALLYVKLATPLPRLPFSGLKSILDDGSFTVGFGLGISVETEIRNSKDPLIRRLWQELIYPRGLVTGTEDGLQRAYDERFILLTKDVPFHYLTAHLPCRFIVLPNKYFRLTSGFAVRKGSPLKEVFNRALLKVMGSGVLHHLRSRWEKKTLPCLTTEVSAINLHQVTFLFLLLAIVFSATVLLLAGELWHCWQRGQALTP